MSQGIIGQIFRVLSRAAVIKVCEAIKVNLPYFLLLDTRWKSVGRFIIQSFILCAVTLSSVWQYDFRYWSVELDVANV